MAILEHAGKARIVQHCAIYGDLLTDVRWVKTSEPAPYQHPISVYVAFVEPRKRKRSGYTVIPGNIRYVTIEVEEKTVWDSRGIVFCDMREWHRLDDEWRARRVEYVFNLAGAKAGKKGREKHG